MPWAPMSNWPPAMQGSMVLILAQQRHTGRAQGGRDQTGGFRRATFQVLPAE
jgi:hypothetical protein